LSGCGLAGAPTEGVVAERRALRLLGVGRELVSGVPGVARHSVARHVALVVVREGRAILSGAAVGGVVGRGAHRLRESDAGEAAPDGGALPGGVVLVFQLPDVRLAAGVADCSSLEASSQSSACSMPLGSVTLERRPTWS
jgi:hypothetical protein